MQKPADNAELKARLYESLVGVQAHDASKQSIREAHPQLEMLPPTPLGAGWSVGPVPGAYWRWSVLRL